MLVFFLSANIIPFGVRIQKVRSSRNGQLTSIQGNLKTKIVPKNIPFIKEVLYTVMVSKVSKYSFFIWSQNLDTASLCNLQ